MNKSKKVRPRIAYFRYVDLPFEVRSDLEEGAQQEWPESTTCEVFLDPSEKGTMYEVNVMIPDELGVAYALDSESGARLAKMIVDYCPHRGINYRAKIPFCTTCFRELPHLVRDV
jgi:hypothetical protein